MSKCLREREIFACYEGEGTERQRAHLKKCLVCAERLQRLGTEVRGIAEILRTEPAPQTIRPRSIGLVRFVPAVATAVLVFGLGCWAGARLWTPYAASHRSNLIAQARTEGLLPSAQDSPDAFLEAADENPPNLTPSAFYLIYAQDAAETDDLCSEDGGTVLGCL